MEVLFAILLAILSHLGTDVQCFEDEMKVIVIAEVLPDNGVPPGLDWGVGPNVGKVICVNVDDHFGE